jgi:hypothetical protein
MTDIPKCWAELEQIYAHIERNPLDQYREDLLERIEALEDSIADAPTQSFEDVFVKLRVVLQQMRSEDRVAAQSSLQFRLVHSAAYAIAPFSLN